MLVKRAKDKQLDSVCEILAHAFSEDLVIKYMFPTDKSRFNALHAYFKIYIEIANIKDYGYILVTDDFLGAFVAFTYKGLVSKEYSKVNEKIVNTFGKEAQSILSLTNHLESAHPKNNHCYAALLGIRKEARRQSYGIDLIKNYHSLLDNSSTPSYSECTSIKSKALMEKLGYVEYGEPIFFAKNCPVLYPVWRPGVGDD